MAKGSNNQDHHRKTASTEPKVGSDRSAAAHFAGSRDFGIPAEGAGRFIEVAEEAKYQSGGDHLSDPRPVRSGGDGTRESGVGGVESGPGSSSGGDIDTDIVGVGTHGSGVSSGGPDQRRTGADMSDAGSEPHAAKSNQSSRQSSRAMRGDTVNRSGGDNTTTGSGTGSSSVTPFETGDDAAAGEISQGEAGGDDNTDIDNMS